MDSDDVRALSDYLTKGVYPLGLNRDDKRSLRQKANSFLFSDGCLYHRGKEGRKQLVICNAEEKLRIIHAMHTEPGSRGGHNGMNTTIRKISEQYWWRRLVEDVRAFCKSCAVCSHLTVANQRTVYAAPVEWPEEFNSYPEPVYASSAPVAEYTDMTSSSYATDLLRMLSSLYDQKICCDVILSAGRFQTHAHKVVLIASSGFFKSLLLDKDLPFNDVITLSNVSGPCLESLVSYLYTGILRLNRDSVEQTLEGATYLDITSAIELCQRYLHQREDETWHQTEQKLAPEEAPGQALKLADEKPIVKNDEEFAELELFIESHLAENRHLLELTSVKEEDDSGVSEKRIRVKKEHATSNTELQKRSESKTKKYCISADTRKRKKTGEESTSLGHDDSPQQKRPRGQSRKAPEVMEPPPERRYATRSSTGTVVGKKRSGLDVEAYVTSRPVSQAKVKPLPVPLKDQAKKKAPDALSSADLRNLLFSNGNRGKCSVCHASFKLSVGLQLHSVIAHSFALAREASCWLSRKIIGCAIRAKFPGFRQETVAVDGHGNGNETKYSCNSCYASFGLKSEVLVHRMRMHSTSYTCRVPECFKQFRTCLKLQFHQRFKHSVGIQNKTTAPIVSVGQSPIARTATVPRMPADAFAPEDAFSISNKCGWCGQTFGSREQLLEHRQTVHRKPKLPENAVVKKRRVQRDWSCKEKGCGLMFKTKDKLKMHMSEMHPSVVFSCPECRFKTQVEQILLRHLVRRHRERHMCQLCGKAYHKPFLLRVHLFNRHKLSDPQLKLYHCQHEGCDYACPSKNGLNLHVLKHTSGSPFACNLCSKTFKRAVGLDKHINKIHLGIRPYICDKCGVSYGDESELKIHMTRHAENKPYACSYCDYSTFQKGSLKSHLFCRHQVLMDQEMPVMKCDQCSFTTDKKCRFHDHVKMHRNIRDIPCAECGKMFVTKKTLRQHIIKVHRQKSLTCPHCSYSTAVQSKLQEHIRSLHTHQDPNPAVTFVDPSQLQLQSPHQIQMQHCVNGIVPPQLAVMHDYQTLMPMESGVDQQQQQLGITTDAASSSIVVRIPMSLDSGAYCFQTLDRSHLVM